jgi:hypothetical protein
MHVLGVIIGKFDVMRRSLALHALDADRMVAQIALFAQIQQNSRETKSSNSQIISVPDAYKISADTRLREIKKFLCIVARMKVRSVPAATRATQLRLKDPCHLLRQIMKSQTGSTMS